jgi:hypothetical protein
MVMMYVIIASFVPPDVQSDEDTATLDVARHVDVDEDDLEWQRWLADLINPNGSHLTL